MKKTENKITFQVDLNLYSLEAIYGASYLFLDETYIYLEEGSKSKVKVNIKGKKKLTDKKLENLKGEFFNELLNSSLREKISKSNKKLREYIVGRALASALPEKNNFKRNIEEEKKEKLKEDFIDDLFSEKDFNEISVPWKDACLTNKKEEENLVWKKNSKGIAVPWKDVCLTNERKEGSLIWKKNSKGIAVPLDSPCLKNKKNQKRKTAKKPSNKKTKKKIKK